MNRRMYSEISDIVAKANPTLIKYSEEILFNEVWQDETLSSKERSLITLSTLATIGNTEQLSFHIKNAYKNGVSKDELIALTTHLSFYIGLPLSVQLLNKILKF